MLTAKARKPKAIVTAPHPKNTSSPVPINSADALRARTPSIVTERLGLRAAGAAGSAAIVPPPYPHLVGELLAGIPSIRSQKAT